MPGPSATPATSQASSTPPSGTPTFTLPWTELVKPDRSLKAPHEIHERLTQTVVSRWAHVEVQAADPADAAAALLLLLLLRLIGWPSVTMAQP